MSMREAKTMNRSLTSLAFSLIAAAALIAEAARAADLEPPRIQLVDKFGVNVANGQVTHSMEIVSIGGAMGLSDTISIYGNEFDFKGYRGFNHKYYGRALDVAIVNDSYWSLTPRNIMRVYGPTGSADFAYKVGGTIQDFGDATSGYVYEALGDKRNTLDWTHEELIWTTADGTVLRYYRGPMPVKFARSGGQLTSIEYPNGLKVTITSSGMSVNTNTGFQLKRVYEPDATTCPVYNPTVRTSQASGWSTHNPKRVIGINAAYEYCAPTATSCSLENDWPAAQFDWAHCMPDILYRQDAHVDVTTSKGITTTYKFHPYDLAYLEGQGGELASGQQPGNRFSPRLASVSVPNNRDVTLFEYNYFNLYRTWGNSEGWMDMRLQDAGVVKGAKRGTVGAGYDIMRESMYGPQSLGGANAGVSFVQLASMIPGTNSAVDYADTDDGRIEFEHSPRNFPTAYYKKSSPVESYGYDSRGNLTSINYNGTQAYGYSVLAQYPASCTPATRKSCNQATRTRDANGKWTDYTYYDESGQVATVTHPENKAGVRPQTRYYYTQMSATFYDTSGILTQGSLIWMKTSEEYCINSTATAGNCSGNDEVVTTFQYEPKNLLLKGVTVTSPDGVRRTCYQHDIYGNQIGVTTPNANLGSCP